jgi:hypothetical protein
MPGGKPFAKFGSEIPYAEPGWYQGQASPHYTESHVAFRAKVTATYYSGQRVVNCTPNVFVVPAFVWRLPLFVNMHLAFVICPFSCFISPHTSFNSRKQGAQVC